MRRRTTRILLVAVSLMLLLASAAFGLDAAAQRAAAVDLATVQVGSLARSERSGTVRLPLRADLLGATWSGSADGIELRAKGADGRWSRWVALESTGDGPDPGSAEARAATKRTGGRRTAAAPVWVGDASAVQVRGHDGQAVREVRVVAINATGTATVTERRISSARRSAAWVLGSAEPRAEAMPVIPRIHTREEWGAGPAAAEPWYADETGVLGVVVHHTAGTNRYSCSQVPALLRGIQRYHISTNGWNDIGYNFLVDACGGVWEGRGGGITRPVGGAHTSGFNTSTAGIALIGTHAAVRPTASARDALRRLVAWRLDMAHVNPTGKMVLRAASGDRFPVGSRVVVRAVSGHRDLFPTSCPGALEYGALNALARDAWATGGAKVANVTRSFTLRNPVDPLDPTVGRIVVRATGSHRDMTLAVRVERISTNELLHTASIGGNVITTTWLPTNEAAVPSWDVRVRVAGVRGTQRARPATFNLLHVTEDPGFVITTPPNATAAPGGDPIDDQVAFSYTLAREYRLGAWLFDPATGTQVATLREPAYVGTPTAPTELALSIPAKVAEGTYELRIGLPSDTAVGRSIRRYSLVVDR